MITASKPGDDAPKLDKRYDETIKATIDLKNLLDTNEIVLKVESIDEVGLVGITARPRRGNSLEVVIPSSDLGTSTTTSYLVRILFSTNFESIKSATVLIKVHK